MSYIPARRMPHAYADPSPDDDESMTGAIERNADELRRAIGQVPTTAWLLSAVGAGVVGAALFAALRPDRPAARRASSRRKSGGAAPRGRKAAAG